MKELTEPQKLWVAALRSGEFKPARTTLQIDGGYCCLGVACVVAERHGVKVCREKSGRLAGDSLEDQPDVIQWLGIRGTTGEFHGDTVVDLDIKKKDLSMVNDDDVAEGENPFPKIADIIESMPEGLFFPPKSGEAV